MCRRGCPLIHQSDNLEQALSKGLTEASGLPGQAWCKHSPPCGEEHGVNSLAEPSRRISHANAKNVNGHKFTFFSYMENSQDQFIIEPKFPAFKIYIKGSTFFHSLH